MARDFTPVLKRCRALGIEPTVMGYSKKPSTRKVTERRKPSEYSVQLKEKQKVKFIYGVLEKQFRLTYERAAKMKGGTGENLLSLLELRLDNVAFRLGFGRTRNEARQVVRHGHVLVNGRKVDIPSYTVKMNDIIEIREKSRSSEHLKDVFEDTRTRLVPQWLQADQENYKGTVVGIPARDQIELPVNERLIVELYSK